MAHKAIRLRSNSLILLVLSLLVFACFGNTLGVYFNCDDFLHLPYLYRMFHGEPELFLANFSGPWVGEHSLYLFFRPITEVSLIIDYFFNQASPFGYHLSNLLWHTANAFLLFLFTKALLEKKEVGSRQDQLFMALSCATFFAVFPTQSEAVAWILARADLVSTFFFLLSLYFFITNYKNKALSLIAFFACLLSKETAISLPLVIFTLSITLSKADSKKQKLIEASKDLAPYLVTFIVYLAWRYLAIGKLVGGYIGSIGQRLYENSFARWISSGSLWQLLHPFNQTIFSENHFLRLLLRGLYATAGFLLILGTAIDKQITSRQKLVFFSLAFFAATMLPNFQVWGLSSSMSGSRIAYLPSAAIAQIIVFSVYILTVKTAAAKFAKTIKAFSLILLAALTLTCAAITNGNNIAWLHSAKMIKELKCQVENELPTLQGGQKLVLINLPSRVDGAFTFTMRSMLAGLFSDSQRIIALDYHPNWSVFINRSDFAEVLNDKNYKLKVYDGGSGQLTDADFSQPLSSFPALVQNASLSPNPALSSTPTLSLVVGQGPKSSSYYLKPEGLNKFIDPLNVEFLELDIKVTKKPQLIPADDNASLFVIWNNRPADQEDQKEPLWMAVPADGKEHKILVELGAQKRWLLSKNVDSIRLDVATTEYDWQISNAKLISNVQAKTIMPTLRPSYSADNFALAPLSADLKNKDSDKTSTTAKSIRFNFDASKIKAKNVLVEVSKPYASFEHYNHTARTRTLLSSKHLLLKTILEPLTGSFAIETAASPNNDAAVYQVHLAALDDAGQLTGTFSDSITFKSGAPTVIVDLSATKK